MMEGNPQPWSDATVLSFPDPCSAAMIPIKPPVNRMRPNLPGITLT
jgi:hypothetical protein